MNQQPTIVTSVSDNERRADVDGLRAVAVTLVIVFHALPALLPGGFLGVDVFFVISGYVITRRLLDRRESLAAFYVSRARRLLPALFVTVAACLVLGFLLLGAGHFKEMAEAALAAVVGVPNVYFWLTSGYFATDSIYQPLLHLWTLGVEMQFYLLWPLLLLFSKRRPQWWIVIAGLTSFALMLALPDRNANFYNVWGRAFEFIIGASLVLAPKALQRSSLLATAGLAAVIFSAFLMSGDSPLPGALSLLPCLGAAALIHGGHSNLAKVALANPVMVHLGQLSYSLYLVHWPVIVFWGYFRNEGLIWTDYVLMLVAMLALAEGLHWSIEQRFRKPRNDAGRAIAILALLTLGMSCATAVLDGFPFRTGASSLSTATGYDGCDDPFCKFPPDAERLDLVVLGDSHARHLFAGLKELAERSGLAFGVFHLVPHCSPITGVYDEPNYDCASDVRLFNQVMTTARPSHLLLAGRWRNFGSMVSRQRIDEMFREVPLVTHTAAVLAVPEVYLSRDPIECEVPPYVIDLPRRCRTAHRGDAFYARTEASNALLAADFSGFDLILNPFTVLCDDISCRDEVDGSWAYSDGNHLSASGSRFLVRGFAPFLLDWLGKTPL